MRKKRLAAVVATILTIVLGTIYIAYKKHYVKYSACYELPSAQTEFRPLAYSFINTKERLEYRMKFDLEPEEIDRFFKTHDIDLNNHTYLMVYGAPVKDMYHSIKTTLFDDISPCWASARKSRKKCVFINYATPTGNVYIYEIDKDESLTGFDGC